MADDLFGPRDDSPYRRPDAYRPQQQRRGSPAPPRDPAGFLRSCLVKDLQPGHLVRCDSPKCMARVRSISISPFDMAERGIGGGDPQPAVIVSILYMDGPKRGERAEALLHPEDRVRLA